MDCREYSEVAWLWCNRLNQGSAHGALADGRTFALLRRYDGQWIDVLAGEVLGTWPTADAAFDDLELRLAGEGLMLRRRH